MPVLISDHRTMSVVSLDLDTPTPPVSLRGSPDGAETFALPCGIAVRPGGGFLVADRGNDRIVECADLTGTGWRTLGSRGGGELQFAAPSGVAVDGAGRVLVADTGNHRIVRVDDLSGAGWTTFGTFGRPTADDPAAVGTFAQPLAVAVDGLGRVLVADPDAGRVVRFDSMTGAGWVSAGATTDPLWRLGGPVSVAPLTGDGIVVAELAANGISRYDGFPATAPARLRDLPGHAPLRAPSSVAVDGTDLVVCDVALNRLVVLRRDAAGFAPRTELRLGTVDIRRPFAVCAN